MVIKFHDSHRAFQRLPSDMATTSNNKKKGLEILVGGMEWKAIDFKLFPTIAKSLEPTRAQSRIPFKVLLMNDIRSNFQCTIQEIGTLEMDEKLNALSVNKVLKPKHKHLEDKGLTHITCMP